MTTSRGQQRRRTTAFHEAGHAVMAVALNMRLREVTIRPDNEALGSCCPRTPDWFIRETNDGTNSARAQWYATRAIIVSYAGPEAERRYTRRYDHRAARVDYEHSFELAMCYCGSDRQAVALLKWLRITAEEMVRQTHLWKGIKAVAKALIRHERLSGSQVNSLIFDRVETPEPELIKFAR